jgi:hypothetical protein
VYVSRLVANQVRGFEFIIAINQHQGTGQQIRQVQRQGSFASSGGAAQVN